MARRRALCVVPVLAVLVLAAPAAAQLNELPFTRAEPTAVCLRPSGAPGGLVLLGHWSRRDGEVELFSAGVTGLGEATGVRLGPLSTCAAVAEAAGGAAIVAAPVPRRPLRADVRAALRDPGGAFGPAVRIGAANIVPGEPAAAISPAGHAVVAWFQYRGSVAGLDDVDERVVAVRRAPGGGFGPVEPLTPWRESELYDGAVRAGVDDAGVVTLAWTRSEPIAGEPPGPALEVATAASGAAFAVRRLLRGDDELDEPALAVAGDGGALLAADTFGAPAAFERAPGARRFTRVALDAADGGSPAVALRRGGGGVIAWRSRFDGAVQAVTRGAAGAFGPVVDVAAATEDTGTSGWLAVGLSTDGFARPFDFDSARLRAALAPDGRVLLAWTAGAVQAPRLARGALGGTFGPPQRLGSPVRDANGVAPLFTADGRPALAWTDNTGYPQLIELPRGRGRLHLAVAGAPPAADPDPPALAVAIRPYSRLYASEPLPVAVECDRACDVRITGAGRGVVRSAATAGRSRAGRLMVRIPVRELPRRRGTAVLRPRIVATATAPGGRRVSRAVRRPRVRLRPALPVPRLHAVRARRSGRAIVVTWRTSHPARRVQFSVEGRRTRRGTAFDVSGYAIVDGRGRSRFRKAIRPQTPRAVRWINVTAHSRDAARSRSRTVRVR